MRARTGRHRHTDTPSLCNAPDAASASDVDSIAVVLIGRSRRIGRGTHQVNAQRFPGSRMGDPEPVDTAPGEPGQPWLPHG